MSGKRFIAVLFAVTLVATSAVAQIVEEEKNELGGALGRIFVSNEGLKGTNFATPVIHSGNGLTFDVEYARRFFVTPVFSVSAEGIFAWNHDEDINAGGNGTSVVPQQYGEMFFTPAARVNLFPTTAVSPWVSVGAGFAHISESSALGFGSPNPGKNTTSGVLEMGVGIDVKVWSRLSIRGEFRDFWAGQPDFPLADTGKTRQHNYFVAVGAFWRF